MLKGLLSEQEVIATEVQPIFQRIVFQKKKTDCVRYQQDYEGAASEMRKKYSRKKEGKGE
jgi:hypothetical protein